ncbi:MAG: hypothetical protein R3190_09750 [Thermoanaerobaculia bacterium]|nr:hypothetical protein [Thermoanaerobaculia bacterium]
MKPSSRPPVTSWIAVLALLPLAAAAEVPRTAGGRPDLSGTYDVATLTPFERPGSFGDKLELTDAEAEAIANRARMQSQFANRPSDPERGAPRAGANVGGYNYFWLDPGSGAFKVDGKWRTSILTDPADGRLPPMTEEGRARTQARLDMWRRDLQAGTAGAWWLDMEVGPYDHPEQRPFGERCVLGFGSSAGPPVKPVLYNNLKTVVQTESHLVILNEMNHDARIIPIGGEHGSPRIRRWLGDSVAHWEGDTLVVDTIHLRAGEAALSAPDFTINFVTSADLHVVERFTRVDEDTLLYSFTVDDPSTWTRPWSGEYPWPRAQTRMYEYACHEGNYALGNILRGARLAEQEAVAE